MIEFGQLARTPEVSGTMVRVLGLMLVALATSGGEAWALGPGSVDRAYGDAGSVMTALAGDDGQFSCCGTRLPGPIVSRADGSIVVGGSVRDRNGAPAMAVQAFDERGRVEPSFAQDGLAVVQLGSAEPTGRIIGSGSTGSGPAAGVAIAGLHGGTTMGIAKLGRQATPARGGVAVTLRCTGPALAPGCAGVATVR